MARKPESALHKRLKDNLPSSVITRLENRVGVGMPDCLVALIKARFVMIELKVVERGKKVRLSPHQISFNLKHGMIGMPVWILVQHHPKGTTKRSEIRLMLYHGKQAQDLFEQGTDLLPVESWALDAVDWKHMHHILSTH